MAAEICCLSSFFLFIRETIFRSLIVTEVVAFAVHSRGAPSYAMREKNVRRKVCPLGPFGVPVEPHLLYVFADSWVQKAAQGLTGANRFPDRRRRGWLMQVGQQVNRGSRQHQISRGSLFSERSSHLRTRPQSLR